MRSTASRVFQFGIGAAYCTSDPTRDLKEALTKAPKGDPRPALTDPDDVGELMRRIEVYDAKNGGLVRYALKLIALTMVRPGELRLAEWTEFDETNRVWLIPAEKMKMRDDHEVPLSRQALAIVAALKPLTGRGRYLFSYDDDVPMSDNTLNKALRIMGYDTGPGGDHCAHGFRSTASTLLNEEGAFDGDVVEAQLAHDTEEKKRRRRDEVVRRQLGKGDKNKIRGIYNRAGLLGRARAFNAALVRSPRQPARRCARRLAAQIGGLACSQFDPRQRSVKFVHAVEVDHGLASHLVGPDPLLGDQLISLSLSEFAIAATVLELDEPALLVVVIVNHGSCIYFDDLRHNRTKTR
jgi:Phage integrase family